MMHHNTGPPRLPRDRRGGVRSDPLVLLTQRVPSVREALLTVRIRTLLLPLLLVGVLGLVSSWFIASLAGVRRHALPPKNSTDVESLQRAAQITLPVKVRHMRKSPLQRHRSRSSLQWTSCTISCPPGRPSVSVFSRGLRYPLWNPCVIERRISMLQEPEPALTAS